MFNKDFYPTPVALIEKMLSEYLEPHAVSRGFAGISRYEYKIEGTILEPSAGKGDILDFITENTSRYNNREHYVIESEPELQHILRGKDYTVVDSDFLRYESDMLFDHIIMNPPFSAGAEHLLKAIEIAEQTNIVCLLNSETIKNTHSQIKKELGAALKKWDAKITYHQGEFVNAERTTNVEVAIVKLRVEKENRFSFDFGQEEEIDLSSTDFKTSEIARKDVLGNMIAIFEDARKSYVQLLKAEERFYSKANAISPVVPHILENATGSKQDRFNYVTSRLKASMWNTVISHLELDKYMSYSAREDFSKYVTQQAKMRFSTEAVKELFDFIMLNQHTIMDQAILEVFDHLTKHHHENRSGVEGWKTNDAYKVNKKLIIPNGVMMSWYGQNAKDYGSEFRSGWGTNTRFSDIDKVMAYISGKPGGYSLVDTVLENAFKEIGTLHTGDKFNNKTQSTFFDIKFWKKGTVHLTFRDDFIWEQFNLRVAKARNWLPESQWSDIKDYKTRKPIYDHERTLG